MANKHKSLAFWPSLLLAERNYYSFTSPFKKVAKPDFAGNLWWSATLKKQKLYSPLFDFLSATLRFAALTIILHRI